MKYPALQFARHWLVLDYVVFSVVVLVTAVEVLRKRFLRKLVRQLEMHWEVELRWVVEQSVQLKRQVVVTV
jgi:hypothetical protein